MARSNGLIWPTPQVWNACSDVTVKAHSGGTTALVSLPVKKPTWALTQTHHRPVVTVKPTAVTGADETAADPALAAPTLLPTSGQEQQQEQEQQQQEQQQEQEKREQPPRPLQPA